MPTNVTAVKDGDAARELARKFMFSMAVGEVVKLVFGLDVGLGAGISVGLLSYAKRSVEFFVGEVADQMWKWRQSVSPQEAAAVFTATANQSFGEAKELAHEALRNNAPDTTAADREVAANILAGISMSLRQTLPHDNLGRSICPVDFLPKDRNAVLGLLPTVIPPYLPPCPLPNSPYYLEELCGMGGFGAVYKASISGETLPRGVKVCLDPERVEALRNEKRRLEQIEQKSQRQTETVTSTEGSREWLNSVVSLYGHNLEHDPYYLVFEYMPDGDLATYVRTFSATNGRTMNSEEVLRLMGQLATSVSVIHRAGLIHRDLKPTNILRKGEQFKIGDFGLGMSADRRSLSYSQIQSISQRSQQFRGGGTAIYMSPEQEVGEDYPSNDVYSLGIIWYQLVVGEFSKRLPTEWEDSLRARNIPDEQIQTIKRWVLCWRLLTEEGPPRFGNRVLHRCEMPIEHFRVDGAFHVFG